MEEKYFYFITTFQSYNDYGINQSRCWGFYDLFIEAQNVVINNVSDIYENTYHYAIIEEYEMGIFGATLNRWFYKYNPENKKYEPMSEPEQLKHFIGFALS